MRWAGWALCAVGCASTQPQLPKPRLTHRSEVVLRCTPTDAAVFLDGVEQGTCEDYDGEPVALGLGQGARKVEVKKHGFQSWESWMQADGTRVVVQVSLIPHGGSSP